jgi:hypothetical protein
MDDVRTGRPARQYVVWAVQAAAALVAALWGYDFGAQLSGWVLGVVAAANCGVFAALLAGAAIHRLLGTPGVRGPD